MITFASPPATVETTTQLTPIITASPSANTLTTTTDLNITTVAEGNQKAYFYCLSNCKIKDKITHLREI